MTRKRNTGRGDAATTDRALLPVEWSEHFGATMLCPYCGDQHVSGVHPSAVHVLPPGAAPGLLTVDSKGIHLDKTIPNRRRGVLVVLEFFCESGHAWALYFSFHKGSTLVERVTRHLNGERNETTIWRT